MNFPADLLYTKDHEWVRIEGEVATVGITAYAAGELGDIVYIDINTVGETLKEHEAFGTVEAVKTVSDLFMPMAGTILEMNTDLNNAPETVNNDCYGKGWMVKVNIGTSPDLSGLMKADAYQASIGK